MRRVLAALYYDLAGSANNGAVEGLRRLAAVNHILSGSDFPSKPATGIAANVEGFRTLGGLRHAQHEAIAKDNALALFPRLAPREGSTRAPAARSQRRRRHARDKA
ncbi:MAG: hypothetical protein V4754_13895 [Pseudomonadota bacterium]